MTSSTRSEPLFIRLGQFELEKDLVFEQDSKIQKIMKECIVTEAQEATDGRTIRYTAIHDQFDKIQEGCLIPTYIWAWSQEKPKAVFVKPRPAHETFGM